MSHWLWSRLRQKFHINFNYKRTILVVLEYGAMYLSSNVDKAADKGLSEYHSRKTILRCKQSYDASSSRRGRILGCTSIFRFPEKVLEARLIVVAYNQIPYILRNGNICILELEYQITKTNRLWHTMGFHGVAFRKRNTFQQERRNSQFYYYWGPNLVNPSEPGSSPTPPYQVSTRIYFLEIDISM